MGITYQLGQEDYWNYHEIVAGRLPIWKRLEIAPSVIFSGFIAYNHWDAHPRDGILRAFATWIVSFTFFIATSFAIRKARLLSALKETPWTIGLHTIHLEPNTFHERSAVREVIVEWSKITQITETGPLIIFYLNPRHGFFVPKKAFQNQEQAQAFLETAQAFQKSALDGTTLVLTTDDGAWPPAPKRINLS